jgi:hypothetical protein
MAVPDVVTAVWKETAAMVVSVAAAVAIVAVRSANPCG